MLKQNIRIILIYIRNVEKYEHLYGFMNDVQSCDLFVNFVGSHYITINCIFVQIVCYSFIVFILRITKKHLSKRKLNEKN